jgi:hypothetical protein
MSKKHQITLSLATETIAKKRYVLFVYYQGFFLFPSKKDVTFVILYMYAYHLSIYHCHIYIENADDIALPIIFVVIGSFIYH